MANIKLVSGEIVTVIHYKDIHDLIAEKLSGELAEMVDSMNTETKNLFKLYYKAGELAGDMENFNTDFGDMVKQWCEYRTSKDPEIHQPQRIIKLLDAFLTAERAEKVAEMMKKAGEIDDGLSEII